MSVNADIPVRIADDMPVAPKPLPDITFMPVLLKVDSLIFLFDFDEMPSYLSFSRAMTLLA